MTNTLTHTDLLTTATVQQLVDQFRRRGTEIMVAYRDRCAITAELKERYRRGEVEAGKRLVKDFMKWARSNLGFSATKLGSMMAVGENPHFKHWNSTELAYIEPNALEYLSQKNVQAHPEYRTEINRLKKRAIKGEYLTYGACRSYLYPKGGAPAQQSNRKLREISVSHNYNVLILRVDQEVFSSSDLDILYAKLKTKVEL